MAFFLHFAFCICFALLCFGFALLCFAFALQTSRLTRGSQKYWQPHRKSRVPKSPPPGGVKGALLQSVGIIFDVYLEWGNLVRQQQCRRVSGPLSHRSRWGAKCAHATFGVDGLIHRVVLSLESRSRLKKLDRVATVASLTHSHAP